MRPTRIKLSCFCLVRVAPAEFPSEHDWPASEGPPPILGPRFWGCVFYSKHGTPYPTLFIT